MPILRTLAVTLGLLLGGWLTFDGVRAFVVGDYVTPSSGDYAGQLGPWSHVVAAIGLDPRSPPVKAAHVLLGVLWLTAAAAFTRQQRWSRRTLLTAAVASLWYVPFGTLVGVIELALLFGPLRKPRMGGTVTEDLRRGRVE